MPIVFPDSIVIALGPVSIRWYGLAYAVGILLAYYYAKVLTHGIATPLSTIHIEKWFLFWAPLGVIVGGRLGHCVLYARDSYLTHPLSILKVWEGGMAFHGGLVGVILSGLYYAWKNRISAASLGDLAACVCPIGIAFGRVGNFINQELYGKISNVPWAVIFPRLNDGLPRHPSQLYEAALEGVLLGSVLYILWKKGWGRIPWKLTGVFLIGYGVARFFCEFFRTPTDGLLGTFNASMWVVLQGVWALLGSSAYLRMQHQQPYYTQRKILLSLSLGVSLTLLLIAGKISMRTLHFLSNPLTTGQFLSLFAMESGIWLLAPSLLLVQAGFACMGSWLMGIFFLGSFLKKSLAFLYKSVLQRYPKHFGALNRH